MDFFANLFKKKPPIRMAKPQGGSAHTASDIEYNESKKAQNDNIDRILEKIKRSGYDSLSEEERSQLFQRKK